MLKPLYFAALTLATASAFVPAPMAVGPSKAAALGQRHSSSSVSSLQMGFFDGLMGGGNNQPVPDVQPGQPVAQGLQPQPGRVLITFEPSGAQVNARPGERLGDAAQRSGLQVPYGCKEGVCGTCQAVMKQPNGYVNDIRICRDIVPKTNLDSPDREKMWGDLRGGKKSVAELRSTPQSLTITLQNPNLALKKQQSWEQVKQSAAKNTKDWLDPNYKPNARGGAPPPGGTPPPPPKRGWPFG
mmetsp:Transcript_63307/g.131707  ORF Transcript_63307/g.131707 Transcript_63307/m.131707 type:complete len:242 (-) Transcript_63307:144-869(-)|eukprot:CAMPEP_0181319328 /NCGR_PEP_ID=MMETSP1101-20121128/17508_1 /TAXON_ID=46948 /ORGANISM="Rhodomonas abbreviata, Strain Caron Lab Isolate" /LENGTH=241 /DNA_ID=CAMNT_0023426911 /DNA_START=28 /DNA_END=753 /DNA_ORIENTATION=+